VRKEEEKVRRELIKQEYLQRKRQELLEEQVAVKPRPKTLSARRPRLKSPQHPGSPLSKASPGRGESLPGGSLLWTDTHFFGHRCVQKCVFKYKYKIRN